MSFFPLAIKSSVTDPGVPRSLSGSLRQEVLVDEFLDSVNLIRPHPAYFVIRREIARLGNDTVDRFLTFGVCPRAKGLLI